MSMQRFSPPDKQSVWLIAGATASGKSALAERLAGYYNGAVINADSMQVYEGLPLLSAQPDTAGTIPHYLYGFVDPAQRFSAAAWRTAALKAIDAAFAAGKQPIVVGGTGLYLRVLTDGLSPIPDIAEADSAAWLRAHERTETPALREKLHALEPQCQIPDRGRLLRRLMVAELTGKPLSFWQQQRGEPLAYPALNFLLDIEPEVLRGRIKARADALWDKGVLEEVAAFKLRAIAEDRPALKTLGYRALCAYLDGTLTREAAHEFLINTTRQYAKRQRTWFRHQYRAEWCINDTDGLLLR